MQFNSHATNQDIVSGINNLCDSDASSFPIAEKTLYVNAALEELIAEIINADGTWEYDDTNYTNLPRGTGTLVEGQQTYTFASEYLQILMIEVKNSSGNWYKLKPLDKDDLGDSSPDEYFGQLSNGNPQTGLPEYFDQIGDTIFLYPAPTSANVTLTSGLRVWFKRTADLFTTTDTTQEPGLPSSHHMLLVYMASIPYCMKYKKERVPLYQKKVDEMKITLLAHYGQREKAARKKVSMEIIDHD